MARPFHFSKGQSAQTWSPAHLYLLVSGVFLVFIGSVGLVYNSSFALGAGARVDPEASAHVFGIFETNGWHNLAGLLAGVAALAFALKPERARGGIASALATRSALSSESRGQRVTLTMYNSR